MITLELTDEEALNLRNLLDAAVRGQGMRAAEAALVIDMKILNAARQAQSAVANGGPRDDRPALQSD